jgi:hypothetical protein
VNSTKNPGCLLIQRTFSHSQDSSKTICIINIITNFFVNKKLHSTEKWFILLPFLKSVAKKLPLAEVNSCGTALIGCLHSQDPCTEY